MTGSPEPRTVLALFDGTRDAEVRDTRIHNYLEFPLNHLGYRVQYVDVNATALPSPLPSDTAAVISWFEAPLANPSGFLAWAARAETNCVASLRQIAIGDIGASYAPDQADDLDAYLARLGLVRTGNELIMGAHSVVIRQTAGMIGHEVDFSIATGRYQAYRSAASATSHLRIAPRPDAGDNMVDLAVIGERGAYLHESAALSQDGRSGRAYWVVDPFDFLQAVLGDQTRPIPDVTTAFGRRIFFSTVTSEGWLTAVPARHFDDVPQLGSEALLKTLILPYPDMPTTVAVLTGDLDPGLGGRDAPVALLVAKEVFRQPQVGIATTGASLVRNWDYFATYDRSSETRQIDDLKTDAEATKRPDGLMNLAVRGISNALISDPLLATDRVPNAPRRYSRDAFDLKTEISDAAQTVADLGPTADRPPTFLWTGDARPFEAALAAARRAEVPAIGGGGGVYNGFVRTVSGLSPFSVQVGDEVQVYNALSGDAAYTGYWSSPKHGFQALLQTLEWTDAPRRLKPFEVSYAAQSAIDFGTRRAVELLYQRAASEDVVPLMASDYVAMVMGFRSARIERAGALTWRITDHGDLATIRFDHAANLVLDQAASPGTLGARRSGGSLYVSLVPESREVVVALATGNDGSGLRPGNPVPGLGDSRVPIISVDRKACTTSILARGRVPGSMKWFGQADTTYRLKMVSDAGPATILEQDLTSGPDGHLDILIPANSGDTVAITLDRAC